MTLCILKLATDQPKECDTCHDVNFLHNHVCDHPAEH